MVKQVTLAKEVHDDLPPIVRGVGAMVDTFCSGAGCSKSIEACLAGLSNELEEDWTNQYKFVTAHSDDECTLSRGTFDDDSTVQTDPSKVTDWNIDEHVLTRPSDVEAAPAPALLPIRVLATTAESSECSEELEADLCSSEEEQSVTDLAITAEDDRETVHKIDDDQDHSVEFDTDTLEVDDEAIETQFKEDGLAPVPSCLNRTLSKESAIPVLVEKVTHDSEEEDEPTVAASKPHFLKRFMSSRGKVLGQKSLFNGEESDNGEEEDDDEIESREISKLLVSESTVEAEEIARDRSFETVSTAEVSNIPSSSTDKATAKPSGNNIEAVTLESAEATLVTLEKGLSLIHI